MKRKEGEVMVEFESIQYRLSSYDETLIEVGDSL